MNNTVFPGFHGARRAVVVLKQNDIRSSRNDLSYEEKQFLFDDEAFVLSYPPPSDSPALPRALMNIIDSDLARPGLVLVQSPYDHDAYVELEKAAEAFAIEKMRHFSRLCQLLGATFVEAEQVEVKRGTESAVYSVKGSAGPLKAEGKVSTDEEQSLSRKFSIRSTFPGKAPDGEGAEKFLRSKNLFGDTVMRQLLEQCSDDSNRLLEQQVTISLSSETKSTLGVVGKLNLPTKFGISADCKKIASSSEEYSLTLLVKFEH
jgi:hypothetical protein